jgi:glycerol-3-phosphate acyltransferase PlsX
MGGDHAPGPMVVGALRAAREYGIASLLVGERTEIEPLLAKAGRERHLIEVAHAGEVIGMDEHPAEAVRNRPDSSLVRSIELLRDGAGGSSVSLGNSGAIMAAAVLRLRRLPGVRRPVIASLLRLPGGATVWMDIGANSDCDADHLCQFAQMGEIYARTELKIERPTVGLLNMGHEKGKGPQVVKDAAARITAKGLNFVGNVEPQMMLRAEVDVVVADGFTMNIAVKTLEALADLIFGTVREYARSSLRGRLGGMLLRPAFAGLRSHVDYREIGAAPLLGVNGLVLIGHGRSRERAVVGALRQADRLARVDAVSQLARAFAT